MMTTLTIIRYPKLFIPFAFFAMAVHRLPLWINKKISFYKLMGSGRNGTFDQQPDFRQWAILAVFPGEIESKSDDEKYLTKKYYGSFIAGWFNIFNCETSTFIMTPIEGHGTWDGKKVFGELPAKSEYEGPVAVLTRATVRLNKLKFFWANVPPVAALMQGAKGFITSFGIGEIPWIKQATFSVWQSKTAMKEFAYGMKEHAEVIKKTRQQDWYSEDMFTRFIILKSTGTINQKRPLNGML